MQENYVITIYGIPNCDKVRKAKTWLDKQNARYQFHNYKVLGCDQSLADNLLQRISYNEVINKRGTTWRKLPENSKNSLDTLTARKLIQEQPSMITRPIFEIDGEWILGFNEKLLADKILG